MASFLAGIKVLSHGKPRTYDPQLPPGGTLQQDSKTRAEDNAVELAHHGSANHRDAAVHQDEPRSPQEAHTYDPPSPSSPSDLEASLPPTPKQGETAGALPSWSYPAMSKWRVLCCCLTYLGNGMNDSAPGALIPYIEAWYGIGYATVSMIWIANAAGFVLAAFGIDAIASRLGRARSLMLSEAVNMAAYALAASAPPFPAVAVAYFLLGAGIALNLALNNVFCANLANATVILGAAHGSYGLGGVIAPILATALVSRGVPWARFYLITLALRAVCFVFAAWAFWAYEREGTTQFANSLQHVASRQSAAGAEGAGEGSKMKMLGRALKNRTTLIGALFIFAYQGAEVSESGWFIQYLISYRHGDPARVGYVTAGFWAGIMLGRFVLTHAARRIGEKRYIVALTIGVIGFQIMAWQVPHVVGDAVAVSILGLLLGPVYPCAQTVFTRLLPSSIQTTAISFISSAGSSGGAVVPFVTGLIAQQVGTAVLHPICIGAYVIMLASLPFLPRTLKRCE